VSLPSLRTLKISDSYPFFCGIVKQLLAYDPESTPGTAFFFLHPFALNKSENKRMMEIVGLNNLRICYLSILNHPKRDFLGDMNSVFKLLTIRDTSCTGVTGQEAIISKLQRSD
jgi:hypothetical protein